MNKLKLLEKFNKISLEEGETCAFQYLYDNTDINSFVKFGITCKKDKRKRAIKRTELFNSHGFIKYIKEKKEVLTSILISDLWDEFLYWFFHTKEIHSFLSFSLILDSNPEKFISAIRFTNSFLEEKVFEILLQLEIPKKFSNHKKFWNKIFKDDQLYWKDICKNSENWNLSNVEDFLGNLINWIEIKRFEDISNERLDLLSKTYNFIISLYLSENYEQSKEVSFDNLDESFWNSFEKLNTSLVESFDHILSYVWLQEAVIIPYSYDLNIEPKFKNESMDFSFISEKKLSDWKKDGDRYELNRIRYKELGMKISSYLIHEKEVNIPEGKSEQDKLNNVELFINSRTTDAFLSDLHLDKMTINRKEVNTHSIVQPIIAYSFNRKLRYENELERLHSQSNSWQWSYFQLNELSRKKDVDCFPFFLMSEEDYISHNIQANHREQQNVYQELIHQFGYRITENYMFDRHNIGYDVWHSPFVRLGDMLFCPMLFFAQNEWFYSIAQIVIKNYDRNVKTRTPSSREMEKALLNIFSKCNPNWHCVIPEFKHDGDIDLIISDEKSDLLIQLKRTYFRTNLKDAYFETIRSDRKAISQLINGELFLIDNPSCFQLKNNTVKWLVSTSFENVNQVFNDCRKVNYLDLIWVLENKTFESVNQLNEYIQSDKVLDEKLFK